MTDELIKTFANPLRPLFFWDADVREGKANQRWMRNFAKEALDRYRAKTTDEDLEEDPSAIAAFLRAEYPSEEGRIGDFILFLLAGFDTAAYTTCWCLIELCQNPETYEKAMAELASVNPGLGPATLLPLSSLKYLNMCIKESSRKWPMAGVGLHRQAKEDTQLGGFDIPKGSIILNVVPYAGRVILEDGEGFNPERWAPEHKDYNTVNKYNWMFSQGKRNCIGQNMANMQVLYTLATLLQHFHFNLVSDVRPEMATTYKPCNLSFDITPRRSAAAPAEATVGTN